jgi:hypothetical protein
MSLPAFLLTERATILLDWASSLIMISTVWGWFYKRIASTLNVTYNTGNQWGLAAALSPAFVVLAVAQSGIKSRVLMYLVFGLALIPAFIIIVVNLLVGFLVWLLRSTLNEGAIGKLMFFLAFVTWNISKAIAWYIASH